MRILMINKFHYIKGGSETYYFALKKLLQEHGHEVIDFSMEDDKNFDSPYEKYFVENVEYNGKTGVMDKLRMASRIIYSREAQHKLTELIEETRPDIAHLHIFQHQMSPSILRTLEKAKIPMVYTAHDLKMLCLNYKMLNHTGICERCKGHRYYNCMKYKCIKESTAKSMICMMEGYLHRLLGSYDKIHAIITPSKFYYDKFVEFGVNPNRLCHIPNFLDVQEKPEYGETENYFFYMGRISEEKGIFTMIQAFEGKKYDLKIAGTGPLFGKLQEYVQDHQITNIEFMGFRQGEELQELVKNAKAVILPSEWYENGPYSGIEAISQGKVIIGSDMGGIPELIENGVNGYIFKAGDVKGLQRCVEKIVNTDSESYQKMQHRSRELYQQVYTKDNHYRLLNSVYKALLENR